MSIKASDGNLDGVFLFNNYHLSIWWERSRGIEFNHLRCLQSSFPPLSLYGSSPSLYMMSAASSGELVTKSWYCSHASDQSVGFIFFWPAFTKSSEIGATGPLVLPSPSYQATRGWRKRFILIKIQMHSHLIVEEDVVVQLALHWPLTSVQ